MTTLIGKTLSHYRFVDQLGAGGMGVVYRAHDERLKRDVAIKLLPHGAVADPTARTRLLQEARTASALNHPNICTIYEVCEVDGEVFIAMELVAGRPLSEVIPRDGLTAGEASRYASQVAEALACAHENGVIHRDLKPSNILVTPEERIKVLDFGIAKRSGMVSDAAVSAPETALTETGMIAGTLEYLAPEVLRGAPADKRSDIWSLGVVLFEMATGHRPFRTRTSYELTAEILGPVPVSVPPSVHAGLAAVIGGCLAKDSGRRYARASDAGAVLEALGPGSTNAVATDSRNRRSRSRVSVAATGLALLGAIGLAVVLTRLLGHPSPPPPLLQATLELPAGVDLDTGSSSIAISPDGRTVAFAANQRIWVRALDGSSARPVAGTEGATYPFWSPEGRFIGFFANQKLKRVPATGGAVEAICDAIDGRGASWGSKGTIVFAPAPLGGLYEVPASGGKAIAVTTAGNGSHRLPHFLPDGRRLLYYGGAGIWSLDLRSGKTSFVLSAESEGLYVEPGYLVFVRGENLMAQRMDPRSLRLRGDPVPIAEGIGLNRCTGAYALSSDGLLLYLSRNYSPEAQLTWFDPEGGRLGSIGDAKRFSAIEFAPDGAHVLAIEQKDGLDVWIYDLTRGAGTRFTGDHGAAFAIWSPDGLQIAYNSFSAGGMWVKPTDGTSEARALVRGRFAGPTGWSPDGAAIAFDSQTPKSGTDVSILPLGGSGQPYALIATPATERLATFSPDGRWIAYDSDESGRVEVYVTQFPGGGGKSQVSTQGGTGAAWLRDGHRIIYRTPEGRLVAVGVTARGTSLDFSPPKPLLGGRVAPGVWAVAPTGDKILMAVPTGEEAPKLTVVSNWRALMDRK